MKNIHFILLLYFSFSLSKANDSTVKFNLVIVVDEKVLINNFYDFVILTSSNDGSSSKFQADYLPGSLCISQSVADSLKSTKADNIYLSFTLRGEKLYNYTFKININIIRKNYDYLVLKIYTYRKFKKYFSLPIHTPFFVDMYYPGGSTLYITRKKFIR